MNWIKYEKEKAKIREKNLKSEEYENEIKKLIEKLERNNK